VIGLSIAYQLAKSDLSVALFDRAKLGRESSWAGAGLLPPANNSPTDDSLDQLKALSQRLFPTLSESLLAETGIDNGFWKCGAVYLGRTPGEVSSIEGIKLQWKDESIIFETLDPHQLRERVPALDGTADQIKSAVYLPDEFQICNPHHLKALIAACRTRGVDLFEETDIHDFEIRNEKLTTVRTTAGPFQADHFCAACGSWTGRLVKQLDIEISMIPVRGQMLAFKTERPILSTVVNDCSRYLVPRRDGWVLAGSTLEHAGFDKNMTAEGQKGLYDFANGLIPALNASTLTNRWAGLRPGTFDGFPYLGRCPTIPNLIVAAGHFRCGLQTSTGTAQVICDLVTGTQPEIDLEPFRISRG